MSLIIPKDTLTAKQEALLLKQSKIQELRTNFKPFPKTHKLYADMGTFYIAPRAIGIPGKTWQEYYSLPDYKIKFNCLTQLFTGNQGDNPDDRGEDRNQVELVENAVKNLKDYGMAFLNVSTGAGKTLSSMHVIKKLGRRCLVVVFNLELQKQMYEEIKKNTDVRVYWYKLNDVPPKDAQIVVCGLVKAANCDVQFLSTFQTLVLDECDQTAAISYIPLFLKCCPTYLLGLSATIKKSNGFEKMMYKYFGNKDTFITMFITKPNVSVIKYQTNFVPNIETKVNTLGEVQIDKAEIDRSLAENEERNQLIADLVYEKSKDGQCLVLSPRKENIIWLYNNLYNKIIKPKRQAFYNACKDHLKPKWKEYIESWTELEQAQYIADNSKKVVLREAARELYETSKQIDYKTVGKKNIDKTCRILIGGLQSCGRGFDCKAKYVFILGVPPNLIQFAGRLRDPNGFIYIFVDKYQKFELDWIQKSMPYLRKLECKLFFQNNGEKEIFPYVAPRRGKKEEISLLDDIED